MNILRKFTIQNLKLNKKRTIVTIIGIILSTALICGVAGLVTSFQKTLVNEERENDGNYHTIFYDVSKDNLKYIENNNKVESYFLTNQIGWANLKDSKNKDKPYVSVLEYDQKALENNGLHLKEGRMPQNSDEIVISEHINTNGRVQLNIGDTVTFDIGTRKLNDGTILTTKDAYTSKTADESGNEIEENITDTQSKTYKIVGIIQRPNYTIEGYRSPGYTVISYMQDVKEKSDISVLYTNPKEYEENDKAIKDTIKSENVHNNQDLLRYEGALSDNTLKVVYGIAGVVIAIIVVSSVFVIRNSFSISVAEKNKQYGMMSSIGATSKQIKRTVLLEGFLIGLIAIPLGIVAGIIAIMILLQVVNYLLADMLNGIAFEYSIPLVAILISIVISYVTIYLSCLIPARRAAKISPIESIRGNNDIKIKSKKLKTNKLVEKLFGIGGVIASKNLKRSKKKYRTTVISIVISIVIFVSLSSFITCGNKVSSLYYTELDFNMNVSGLNNEGTFEKISKMENIDKCAYYTEPCSVIIDMNKYGTDFGKGYEGKEKGTSLIVYNNEYFKQYIQKLGLKEQNYKDAVILIDEMVTIGTDNKKTFEKIYNLKDGDNIPVTIEEKEYDLTITKDTTDRPMGLEGTYYSSGMIVVSKDFMKNIDKDFTLDDSTMFLHTNNATELENTLNDLSNQNQEYKNISVLNYETLAEQENRMVLVIEIFLYGFITVITLIGVTNIFNTITTNMILRSKEFAMLKSIGMTLKEFNRMIRLESILYGLKSLVIGIPIGILGSYWIYKSFASSVDIGYTLPWFSILLSIVFVFIIVGCTMKYSLNKINKQNIIETIRQDNI